MTARPLGVDAATKATLRLETSWSVDCNRVASPTLGSLPSEKLTTVPGVGRRDDSSGVTTRLLGFDAASTAILRLETTLSVNRNRVASFTLGSLTSERSATAMEFGRCDDSTDVTARLLGIDAGSKATLRLETIGAMGCNLAASPTTDSLPLERFATAMEFGRCGDSTDVTARLLGVDAGSKATLRLETIGAMGCNLVASPTTGSLPLEKFASATGLVRREDSGLGESAKVTRTLDVFDAWAAKAILGLMSS